MNKQIEEIAHILCGMKSSCGSCMFHKTRCLEYMDAEQIYNAGYRKQSEAHWIVRSHSYECSNCEFVYQTDVSAKEYDPITDFCLHFCSVCGAKMRGEAR